MVVVFSSSEKHLNGTLAALPEAAGARVAGSWAVFERQAPSAACAVAVLDRLPDWADRLAAFRARGPIRALVVVTGLSAENARCLGRIVVEDVVWTEEVSDGLWPAVSRARQCGLLERVAAELERSARLAPELRAALGHACRAERPVLSVAALARHGGRDRTSLWRYWSAATGGDPAFRMQDLLGWLVLLRATAARAGGRSWAGVCDDLGINEHTLSRTARRLAGSSLRGLSAAGTEGLLERFAERALTPLLGADAATNCTLSPPRAVAAKVETCELDITPG